MRKTPWFPPDTYPARRGLYERDWRQTDILPVEERKIYLDLWEPIDDPSDSLYPGIWFVPPDWNDASRQHLPWRGLDLTGAARKGKE